MIYIFPFFATKTVMAVISISILGWFPFSRFWVPFRLVRWCPETPTSSTIELLFFFIYIFPLRSKICLQRKRNSDIHLTISDTYSIFSYFSPIQSKILPIITAYQKQQIYRKCIRHKIRYENQLDAVF